jgi:tetratricopeptide (TPR) repeat protein
MVKYGRRSIKLEITPTARENGGDMAKENKKTVIKKEVTVPLSLFNFIHIAFAILIIACAVLTAIFLSDVMKLGTEIDNIKTKIENTQLESPKLSGTEAYFLDEYKELSNKTDTAIERILTIVGIAAGFTAVFGALLAFRAPREITRNMDKLEEMINDSKKAAQEGIREAKYYAEIAGALSEQVNKHFTVRDKIDRLDKIIKDQPDFSHGYLVRAHLYCRLSNFGNKIDRLYVELAKNDSIKALNLGEKSSDCYNTIGSMYFVLNEFENAIDNYSQAIEDDNNCALFYNNRGLAYECIGEYGKAFNDHNIAVSLGNYKFFSLSGRGKFYYSMLVENKYFDEKDRQNIIKSMIDDFEKAKELDPSHPEISVWIEWAYALRDDNPPTPPEDNTGGFDEPQPENADETDETKTPQ